MQFTGKPTGTLRDDAHWNPDHLAIEATLDVRDDDSVHQFSCCVYRRALDNAVRRSGPLDGEEALRIYNDHIERIHAVVGRKLRAGEFDENLIIFVEGAELE